MDQLLRAILGQVTEMMKEIDTLGAIIIILLLGILITLIIGMVHFWHYG